MGNVASCAPSIIYTSNVKVIFIDGRFHVYTWPLKAAELLADHPGSFLCDFSYLKIGHRIPGLSADEYLHPRRTYFMLPMEMLYSVLTGEEMSFLNEKASKKQWSMNLSKIFQVLVDFNRLFPTPESEKRLMGRAVRKEDDGELINGRERQRSWRPSLETIQEIPTPADE